ncbi:Spermidine/putrescine transport system permease protein PotB [Aedoeadaptatus ivorii]|uniref:Spermidine/putrescine transport system permease protein PotB n=1 Tax=Aedoeadaptatus ivorii TaxID=54006 RepID=A0A3S4ZPZ9_9FIRM|nr:ABC transporter permease subunit [Peptoniphilus ivorii]MDQ0508026.1 putative spermidine/putrescine transport system permease protein [Peptoniphilus ivorii]VEJ34913.1 Spermidine/putrescine transport system permease protein PotB [Peptoniphilus ivorii]
MKKNSKLLDILAFVVIGLFLILPLFMTVVYSFFRDFTKIIPREFTFDFYRELFTATEIWPVLIRTVLISVLPVLITVMIMLLALYAARVYYPKAEVIMDAVSKIPYGIQGVIMAVSLIVLYGNSENFYGNRIFLLVCSYCVLICPYMYQGVKNTLTAIDMTPMLEAAEILGASSLRTFVTIIVPAAYRGLLATMLLSAGLLFADFVLVNILAGSYYETLGIFLNRMLSVSGPTAAAISTIMSVVMLALSALVNHLNARQSSPQNGSKEN